MTPERIAQIQKNHAEAQAEIDKADMLPAIVEVFQEDRASLLADVERLRQAIMDARDYVEHQDICAGRIADWRLGATCTCGGDAILAKINAALSA